MGDRPSESSDPDVHYLLARRDGLRVMDDAAAASVAGHQRAVEDRRVQHEEIASELRRLGYEADVD